jgi:hypothetical protein
MSTLATRLSSPRFQRKLFWIGGAVLVVGAAVLIVALAWTGPKPKPVAKGNGHVTRPTEDKTVKFDPAAKKIGERFIETAVARKNLAASWKLVAPDLKSSFTLKRWETGNIPVVPYPADTSRHAPVKIEYSYSNRVMLLILLEPKPGDRTKPQLFHLGLHAYGAGKARHWLVDYWAPYGVPKIPNG